MRSVLRMGTLGATLLLMLVLACAASAATYTPGTEEDQTPATPADCVADAPASADCSLREAIEAANGTSANDVVEVPAGNYVLDPTIDSSHGLTIADGSVGGHLLIHGAGARDVTVIDGGSDGDTARVFTFDHNAAAEVQDLEVTGGAGNGGSNGGAVKIRDNPDAVVTFTRVWFVDNSAENSGGAISNRGRLVLRDSLLSDNIAGQDGGAIENDDEMTLINTTLTGNEANGESTTETVDAVVGTGSGGAIHNTNFSTEDEDEGFMAAINSTIAGNSATGGGGGVATETTGILFFSDATEFNAITNYTNTIVADNSAPTDPNCQNNQSSSDPNPSSLGHNIENGTSCQFTASGDKNAEPRLATLGNNGGPTDTLAELDDSPAIDAADASQCPDADQRGVGRPQGAGCDIGAYERAAAATATATTATPLVAPPITPAASSPQCKDHLPPITTLRNGGLTLKSDSVKLKGRSRDQGAPCPSGVQRVEVTLAQVSGTGLNCKFLKFQDRFALSPFRNCAQRSIRFKANGTTRWNFTFDVSLAPGKYRATARGYDRLRHKETPKKHRNIIYFTVD
jgi:hypothetical protein